MQDTEVVIDDDYINAMAEYFEKQGRQLQGIADNYISAMTRMVQEGMPIGETSETLRTFVNYAQALQREILTTAMKARNLTLDYLEEVDVKDNYQY